MARIITAILLAVILVLQTNKYVGTKLIIKYFGVEKQGNTEGVLLHAFGIFLFGKKYFE